MSLLTILIYILFAFLIGVISNIILGYTWNKGFIFLVILGLLGIIIGHWLFLKVFKIGYWRWAFISMGRVTIHWFWSIVTSIILVILFDKFVGRRRYRR